MKLPLCRCNETVVEVKTVFVYSASSLNVVPFNVVSLLCDIVFTPRLHTHCHVNSLLRRCSDVLNLFALFRFNLH
jgi:hypothetical protein